MKLHFYKYQATGNDFVVIDNRSREIQLSESQVRSICDRRVGVGADGLMLLEKHPSANFNLIYFNRDGSQSLCGNGSRAAVQLASTLGIINGRATFQAYDGAHQGEVLPSGIIKIRMNDVAEVKQIGSDFFIHTGSPHLIRFVNQVENYPVVEEGRKIRYRDDFKPGGTNVNFVELKGANTIYVRTYERGVEDETLSCGTGVTAAALATHYHGFSSPIDIQTKGGNLSVEFKARQSDQLPEPGKSLFHSFHDIFLIGPAKMVFEGYLEL